MTVETGKRAHFAEGAFWIVAIGLVLATVLRTRGILWSPDGLPAWDAAGYLLEGLKSARPLAEGDIKTLLTVLLKPDLHPPLHSFLLGCWLAIFGNEIPVVRTFPTVLFVAALGVLVWIGQLLGPRGRVVALGAAVLFTLSIEGVRYITTPMTENTALLFELVALGLAVRNLDRTDNRSRLVVGIAITLASLTRYNLAPMLLVPLYAHHVWRNLRTPRKLLDPGALLWAAPTFGFLAVWQLLRPDLARNISTFFVNRSSGLEFWSVENLFWVPLTLTRTYLNTPWLAVPLGALFLVSLLPSVVGRDVRVGVGPVKVTLAHSEGMRLLQTFVIVSFGALTWHDYKIDRSLHAVAPFVYLSALWTLANVTVTKPAAAAAAVFAPVALLLGVAGPLYVHQFKEAIPALAKTSDFRPEPPVVEALAFIEKHARKRSMVWVSGWVFRLSPPLIEYWLKSRGVEAKIKLDSPLFGEKTRTGIDASWSEKYAEYVSGTMLVPENLESTTFVTIDIVPGTRYYDGWMAHGNNYARAFQEQTLLPEVDRLEFIDEGLTLRTYGANEAQSELTKEALYNVTKPEDDVGIALPAGTPLFRETFNKRAQWVVVPPWEKEKVKLTRASTTLTVEVPEAIEKLQVCGPSPTVPQTFTSVLHLETRGVKGKAWFHYRGVDEKGALQMTSSGAPDIVQVGPFKADGRQRIEREVFLTPTATTGRLCAILDGVTGTLVLEDLALFGTGAPPPADAPVAAEVAPAVEASANPPIYAEGFDQLSPAWRVLPAEAAAKIKLAPRLGKMAVTVTEAQPSAQVCGPALDVPERYTVAVTTKSQGVTGAPSVQVRGLDAAGELNPGDVTVLGRLDGARADRLVVERKTGTRRARACLVLDGATGTFEVDEVRFAP